MPSACFPPVTGLLPSCCCASRGLHREACPLALAYPARRLLLSLEEGTRPAAMLHEAEIARHATGRVLVGVSRPKEASTAGTRVAACTQQPFVRSGAATQAQPFASKLQGTCRHVGSAASKPWMLAKSPPAFESRVGLQRRSFCSRLAGGRTLVVRACLVLAATWCFPRRATKPGMAAEGFPHCS